jgi:hypothetical protein
MKNWTRAECGSCVRAMATVPRRFQAVGGFVLQGRRGSSFLPWPVEAAALDHEAVDDAVEDGRLIKAVLGVNRKFSTVLGPCPDTAQA